MEPVGTRRADGPDACTCPQGRAAGRRPSRWRRCRHSRGSRSTRSWLPTRRAVKMRSARREASHRENIRSRPGVQHRRGHMTRRGWVVWGTRGEGGGGSGIASPRPATRSSRTRLVTRGGCRRDVVAIAATTMTATPRRVTREIVSFERTHSGAPSDFSRFGASAASAARAGVSAAA